MPKILITENTIINYGDDRGGVDAAAGDIADVTKDTAQKLVAARRALYADKKDDHSKGALDTASAAMLKAAADVRAAKEAAAKDAEKSAE